MNADVLISCNNHKSNVYTYCKNNPVNRIDANGMASKELRYPGQIHNKVQNYIAKKYTAVKKEIRIKLKNGKYGRADLVNIDSGGVWEIKPTSTKFSTAKAQLNRYVNGTAVKYPSLKLHVGGPFSGDNFISGDYAVEYWYDADGIVRYNYYEIEDNKVEIPKVNYTHVIVAGVAVWIIACVALIPWTGGVSAGGLVLV